MNKTCQIKVADAVGQSWVYRLLPESFWPYAQLARWERPIGWQLLMWPGWWSIMLANIHIFVTADSILMDKGIKFSSLIIILFYDILPVLWLFALGAITMRGAGCTYNDIIDEKIDAKISRTRSRPLPSRRVSQTQAILFLGAQLLAGLIILLQFNSFTFQVGIASLVTIAIYPFMKRVTWWPQLFLGFAFSWGALLGWVSVTENLSIAPVLLYCGSIMWVIGYDTIYAHQDKDDDTLAGVKSTARLFGEKTKIAISIFYTAALVLIAVAVFLALSVEQPISSIAALPAYVGLCAGGGHMLWQVKNLEIDNARQCLNLFRSNNFFGWILFTGFSGSFLLFILL